MVLEVCEQSLLDRMRRDYYHRLRDELDYILIQYLLIDSFKNYVQAGEKYPFVEKKELKPGAADPEYLDEEMPLHNNGLVLFIDGKLPKSCKKHIRFKKKNRLLKDNIEHDRSINKFFTEENKFDLQYTYFENPIFEEYITTFIKKDYSLLIQHDPRVKKKERYSLTHYKVRIGLLIPDMAEKLALRLGYISKHINEKDVEEDEIPISEQLEAKFCEYYGIRENAGGRRTAAALAAEYFQDLKAIKSTYTVYAGSCELRTLIKITRNKLWKYCLLVLDKDEIKQIEEKERENENYVNLRQQFGIYEFPDASIVSVLGVRYSETNQSNIPEEKHYKQGERLFLQNKFWRSVDKNMLLILPKREFIHINPVHYPSIYK